MKPGVIIAAACAGMLMLAGCAQRKPPSGQNYYAQATEEYNEHFYQPAIADYEKLIDQYPFSPYAEEAELKIGLAYYKNHDYAESIGALNDFLRMHPTSKYVEQASYYLGMAHFDQIGRPDQDQTHTELALQQFQTLEQRFPESDFAALAHQKVEICRELLARHEYLIGNFYYGRSNYKAAESRMAELMALYPETPIAPDALYDLGETLEKQGKKYSAAQAFTALEHSYPNTTYATKAHAELAKLHQPVDTEEDPLQAVLAESGFSSSDQNADHVAVHESLQNLASAGDAAYGPDGLLILPSKQAAAASTDPKPGPATLRGVRLSSADPPLSVIFDLTGPVTWDDTLDSQSGSSTLSIYLKGVTPAASLAHHLSFDRSIFRDCDIQPDDNGTKITLNTTPVSRYAIVPVSNPNRLLVTFTPIGGPPQSEDSGAGAPPDENSAPAPSEDSGGDTGAM